MNESDETQTINAGDIDLEGWEVLSDEALSEMDRLIRERWGETHE